MHSFKILATVMTKTERFRNRGIHSRCESRVILSYQIHSNTNENFAPSVVYNSCWCVCSIQCFHKSTLTFFFFCKWSVIIFLFFMDSSIFYFTEFCFRSEMSPSRVQSSPSQQKKSLKDKYGHIRSSGYGRKSPSRPAEGKAGKSVWTPAHIQRQKIKGITSEVIMSGNKTVAHLATSNVPLAWN